MVHAIEQSKYFCLALVILLSLAGCKSNQAKNDPEYTSLHTGQTQPSTQNRYVQNNRVSKEGDGAIPVSYQRRDASPAAATDKGIVHLWITDRDKNTYWAGGALVDYPGIGPCVLTADHGLVARTVKKVVNGKEVDMAEYNLPTGGASDTNTLRNAATISGLQLYGLSEHNSPYFSVNRNMIEKIPGSFESACIRLPQDVAKTIPPEQFLPLCGDEPALNQVTQVVGFDGDDSNTSVVHQGNIQEMRDGYFHVSSKLNFEEAPFGMSGSPAFRIEDGYKCVDGTLVGVSKDNTSGETSLEVSSVAQRGVTKKDRPARHLAGHPSSI